MITLVSLQDVVNDLRVDNTSGTVDINSEGLRAVNYILDDLQSRHDWESCQREYILKVYPKIKEYAIPKDLKSIRALYPSSGHFEDFKMKEVAVFKRHMRNGGYWEPIIALERGQYPRLHINYPSNHAKWLLLSSTNALVENGTWMGMSGTSNLRPETSQLNSSRVLTFDVGTGTTEFAIRKSFLPAPVLDDYSAGVITVPINFNDDQWNIERILLRFSYLGSTFHVEQVNPKQADGSYLSPGWNMLKFELQYAYPTLPNDFRPDWVELFFVRKGATTNIIKNYRIGELVAQTYEEMVLRYYSFNAVLDSSAGLYVNHFDGTDVNDSLAFSDEMASMVSAGTAWMLADQQSDDNLSTKNKEKYENLVENFKLKYPSKVMEPDAPTISLGYWV